MCVCGRGRAMACASSFLRVCVFFSSSVNAKKGEGTKTHLKKICACARVRGEERECPRFLHGAPPPFFPTLCKSQRWQEQQWRRRRLW